MRFLSVADRELRSAARQKVTYRTRWITALVFFGLLAWLLWLFRNMSNQRAAPEIFRVYSVLTLVYCIFLSTARTADCISSERRDGTLGLLFLSNLNSAEIITGKLCSTALVSVYGLVAIFPMLALPLLMGGISLDWFARTVLALLDGILFGLAAGFLASVVCQRQFTAIALATGSTILIAGGVMIGAAAATSYGPTKPLGDWLAVFSPLYTLVSAESGRVTRTNHFWHSTATIAGMSLGCLALTTFLLARTWRDRPKSAGVWQRLRFRRRSERTWSTKSAKLRRRLLDINPLFWLAARQPVSAPVFMCLAVVLTMITVYAAAPFWNFVMRAGVYSPVLGHLFAWLWTGLLIHALVLYYAAMTASQRLAEDKQTGALELILSTPTTERTIRRGLWLAYVRKMFFPALLAVLVHLYFIWVCLVMATLDPPGQLPLGATPGEIFWSALLDQPLKGRVIAWEFGFMLRIASLILLQLMVAWLTLGWVGRWLGLRMKHPGFAPITSLALLSAPPIFLFSLACYVAARFHLDNLPVRQFLPLMMWAALAIGMGHCLVLSIWAATRLRYSLRAIAMSRYQPLPTWRWRLPSRRAIVRFAIAAPAVAVLVACLVAGYYGYQNWRSKRAWRTFQTSLKKTGDSLDILPLLPQPANDDINFARSPAFFVLLGDTNRETADLLERMRSFDLPVNNAMGPNAVLLEWNRQLYSSLDWFVERIRQQSSGQSGMNRTEDASAILQELEPQTGNLRDVAAAAIRFPAFQTSTNRDAYAVLHSDRKQILMLERLHVMFQLRACAFLALSRNAEAAEDVLTGLRLAQLARQLPDAGSSVRVQELLARSLQPLWDGLSQHAWTEAQLADIQRELAGFNLLADYTNAVRRVVLANIEVWRAMGDRPEARRTLPASDGGYAAGAAWPLLPRAWWFDSCIELHNAGLNAIEQVDVAAERVQQANVWSDLNGLPLDSRSRELLQQWLWWGANPVSVAFAQTSVNQAIVACALERFRLANGVYPETLDKLVPALLNRIPRDAVSGRPIIYQPGEGSGFILRGVGPNGTDDRKSASSDDWLWTYPTNTPSSKN